jgi:hypothetical protein
MRANFNGQIEWPCTPQRAFDSFRKQYRLTHVRDPVLVSEHIEVFCVIEKLCMAMNG